MNDVMELFNYENQPIRSIEKDGEPWFVAKDVCDILELDNNRQAISGLDEEDLASRTVTSGGQNREMKLVNEPGLYQLVLKSRTPAARAFKKWITHELLPTLRKQGSYSLPGRATLEDVHMPIRRYIALKGLPDPKSFGSLAMRVCKCTSSMGMQVVKNSHKSVSYFPVYVLDLVVPRYLESETEDDALPPSQRNM